MVLEYELEWHAKILVLRIILSTNSRGKPQENIQTNQYISSEINHDKNLFRTLLASDLRFLTLFKLSKTNLLKAIRRFQVVTEIILYRISIRYSSYYSKSPRFGLKIMELNKYLITNNIKECYLRLYNNEVEHQRLYKIWIFFVT